MNALSIEYPLRFAKMAGSGNDFILIDDMDLKLDGTELALLARLICRRKFSIGADGLIVLRPSDVADFKWRFFNADGSEAEMCGNGGRCAARFAVMRKIAGPELSFEAIAGIVRARVKAETVMLGMTTPTGQRDSEPIDVAGEKLDVWFIDTGVPHAVVFYKNLDRLDVKSLGKAIRFHPRFAPAGANANFAAVTSAHSLDLRTYERGVEDETYACGTGAVAASLTAARKGLVSSPVRVTPTGGGVLAIYFQQDGTAFKEVFLEGDAKLIYQGEAGADALIPSKGFEA